MSDAHRRLQHFLPDVGSIETELFAESHRLYEFLESAREIYRVQQLSQLGLVQNTWAVARHTRWDFTMLLLDLVRRTKVLPGIHIASSVKIAPGTKVSSARELLNCWAFLLNLGHLHGTFAVETELLFAVKRSARRAALVEELLTSVPPPSHDFALRILQEERTYQFYQLLAFYRLALLASGQSDLTMWQTLLSAYVLPQAEESPALTRTRLLFRRIRRLAFVTLDASLTPSPLEVRLSELSSSPERLERMLLPPSGFSVGDVFQSLEEFLSREIYNGREVLAVLAGGRSELRRRIESGLTKNGLRYTIESAAKTDHHLSYHSIGRAHPVVRGVVGIPFMRFMRGRQVRFGRRRMEEAFGRWGRILGAQISLVFVQDAAGDQLVYQTHVLRFGRNDYACAIAGALQLNERLRKSVVAATPLAGLEQHIFSGGTRGIIDAALEHVFTGASFWEWGDPAGGHLCVTGPKDLVGGHVADALADRRIGRARVDELKALGERVKHIRAGTIAVALANVVAYGPDRVTQIAELDGVIVGLDSKRSDLVLSLVEAKNMVGAASAATKQLKGALGALNLRQGVRAGEISSSASGRHGQAWVYLRSRYARGHER